MKHSNHTQSLFRWVGSLLIVLLIPAFSASCSKKQEPAPEPPVADQTAKTEPEQPNALQEPKPDPLAADVQDSAVPEAPQPAPDDSDKNSDDADSDDADSDDADSDDADSDDADSDDADSDENTECEDAPKPWLKDQIDKVTAFGHRHEVQGDMSQAVFSELEPSLPAADLKVAPGEDVVTKIESYFKQKCSKDNTNKTVDGITVQLVFCSKAEYKREYQSDGSYNEYQGVAPIGFYPKKVAEDPCHHRMADVAYLSLLSPTDKSTRVYQIGTELDFGYVDGLDDMCSYSLEEFGSFTLVDVVSKPFMDTKGLYIRTRYDHESGIYHDGQDSFTEKKASYMTWLFAGDKQRLVKSWEDSNYKYSNYEDYEESCIAYKRSETYEENYMYYQSGEFNLVKKTANNKAELDKLISKRP